MRKLLNILIRGVIPLIFSGWIFYFTVKSIREYVYYRIMVHRLEQQILYIKAKTAVRESRVSFLNTEKGRKIFIKRVYQEISPP